MLIELRNVSKSYDDRGGRELVSVLENIDLEVDDGESVAVVGPSGSGKSTLLNIIGALDAPSSGQMLLRGQNLALLNEKELARIRNGEIGFIFQLHHLLPQCTVLENVLVPTLAGKIEAGHDEIIERAHHLLKRVRLDAHLGQRPGQLSGGECQRVAVVRALINRPKLLLADEPTGALDRVSAEDLANLLVEVNGEEKVALIVVTHWPEFAHRMSRKYELRNKTLKQMDEWKGGKVER